MVNRARYRTYLCDHAADTTPHVNVTLLGHLEGTCGLLEKWGNPDHLAVAGLLHTAYGTMGFPLAFHTPDARETFAAIVGPRVESLVYFYGSCDRAFLYPQLERLADGSRRTLRNRIADVLACCVGRRRRMDVQFRDRFDDRTYRADAAMTTEFLELTFANEMEIVCRTVSLDDSVRQRWARLFRPVLPLLSPGARVAFGDYLGRLSGG